MAEEHTIDEKVYAVGESQQLSMRDLLNYFAQAGALRVSDLHLKVGCPPVYRIDGALKRMSSPDLDGPTIEALIRGMLSEIEMKMLHDDGSVDSSYITDTMQYRLNCFHDNDGPAAAIRALEQSIPEVEQIGFPNGVWHDIVTMQHGLVLLAGITGAGKSTTIASLIQRIAASRPCRIITLEDPIEYRLRSDQAIVSQREVGRDVPSFEHGLRDCLREDPDVIFVGEMRDREATSWTLTAAETGHLVFSTLHTRDARGTITRILDMYPAQRQDEVATQLSLGLKYILCQKLIPRSNGGGRVVAMEILHNTYGLGNLIRNRKLEQVYTQLQTRIKDIPEERMTTLERSLATLVQGGQISPLEAEKWAEDRAALLAELQRVQGNPIP